MARFFKRRRFNGRRRFRRRRLFSGRRRGRFRRAIKKVARRVGRLNNLIERKQQQVEIPSVQLGNTGLLVHFYQVNQGVDRSQRIGMQTVLTRSIFKLFFEGGAGTTNIKHFIRIGFYMQKKTRTTAGLAPANADIFNPLLITAHPSIWFHEYNTRFDFRHVKTKYTFIDQTTVWESKKLLVIVVKWRSKVFYDGTGNAYGDFMANAPFLYVLSDTATASAPYMSGIVKSYWLDP